MVRGIDAHTRSGRMAWARLEMSVAPLHGKPAPVRLVRRLSPDDASRVRVGSVKTAPLSSRARRMRRRRIGSIVLAALTLLLFVAAVVLTVMRWRG